MLDTWVMRNSGTNVSFGGLDFGNGTYVVVSSAGTILTSLDGVTWTPRSSGTTILLADVAYGNGVFVVVGQSGTICRGASKSGRL